LRIGLAIEYFDPRRGGAEWWTFQHAERLLREGFEVHVVAQEIAADALRPGIVPHPLGRIISPLRRAEAAESVLRSLSLDLVHDMGMGWHCDLFQPHAGCWTAVTREKMRLVAPWLRPWKERVDRLLPRYRRHSRLVEKQCAAAPILLALSHKVAHEYRKYHHYPPDRIQVIYNGVDVERFSPACREECRSVIRRQLGLSDETVLGLAVAHNFTLKGVPTILEAMKTAVRERLPLHFAIVGGRKIKRWQLRANAHGLGKNVTFLGAQNDCLPYYLAADFLAHPSYYDSCSLVLLEAAACGVPVVASLENGAAELLTDGVEGFLIDDPADAPMLAERMRLLLDGSMRKEMGEAARTLALGHTLERNFQEILAVYRQTIARKRRAA
jgi:UDP-glucose:(heptosyl)LPS alpha-1,3-glucosyltransferase